MPIFFQYGSTSCMFIELQLDFYRVSQDEDFLLGMLRDGFQWNIKSVCKHSTQLTVSFFFWLRGRGRVLIFFLYSRSGDVSCWSHFPFFVANGPAFQRRRAHRPNGESRENPLGRRWDWRSPTRCLSRCYHRRTLSSEVPWTGLCQGVHEAFLGSHALSLEGGGHECLESLVTLGIFNRTTGRARARVRFRKRRRHHCSRTPPFGCLMNLLEKKMIPFHFYLVGPFESIIGSFNLICYLQ